MAYALRNESERIYYLQLYTIYSVTRNPLKHLMHNLSFDGTDFMVRCCGSLSLELLGWMDRIIVPIDYPISQSMFITVRLVMFFYLLRNFYWFVQIWCVYPRAPCPQGAIGLLVW